MPEKLELVRESKLHALLPGKGKKARLEASGVFALDDSTCVVAFDNRKQIARIQLSLQKHPANALLPVKSAKSDFESIAYDPQEQRYFLLVEAMKDLDGKFRGVVSEYDRNLEHESSFRLATTFKKRNKGFEGLAHLRHGGEEQLWALCESNDCGKSKKGRGRIQVYRRGADGGWDFARRVRLPASASFRDYADLAFRGSQIAVVSQGSRRLWIGELDASRQGFRGDGVTYAFPSDMYRTVEGVCWLSDSRVVCVSDRVKGKRRHGRAAKDQSIHIFDIP